MKKAISKPKIATPENPEQLKKDLIEEVMNGLIHCSRISISLGLHPVSASIYQAEYELEKILQSEHGN